MLLRQEKTEDREIVESLTREAFWNIHVPGCDEHYLVHTMRHSPDFVRELDYVAEIDSRIVGNIMYAKTILLADDAIEHRVITFGPVSVLPQMQGKGIGSALINHTLKLAKDMGYNCVIIYGDPDYYQRFGFTPAEHYGIRNGDKLWDPALLILELRKGILKGVSGRFIGSDVYNLDPLAADEFDKKFPYKKKEHTASQDRFQEFLRRAHA